MSGSREIRVWDWPLRITHWSFAVLIPFSWWAAENSHWSWHKRSGLILLALLTFRIIWGFVGPETARFAQFVRGPAKVLAYIKGEREPGEKTIGHNPLGAISVVALLSAMLVQVGLGLFAGDPFDGPTGPLNSLAGVTTADLVSESHEVFFYVVVALIIVHLAAIAYYAVLKNNNLVKPMITGKRETASLIDGIATPSFAKVALTAAFSAALAIWIAFGAPPLT